MDNLTFSIEDLYEEVKEKAFGDGAFSREEWNDLIDELLEEKRGTMEIDDDDDWRYITEALQARYEDFGKDADLA